MKDITVIYDTKDGGMTPSYYPTRANAYGNAIISPRNCERLARQTGNSASGKVIIACGQSTHPRGQQESFWNNASAESALFRIECETRSINGHAPNANRNPGPAFHPDG